MRTVAFVENIEFEFQGNVFSKAITVGDVDNDQVIICCDWLLAAVTVNML